MGLRGLEEGTVDKRGPGEGTACQRGPGEGTVIAPPSPPAQAAGRALRMACWPLPSPVQDVEPAEVTVPSGDPAPSHLGRRK